MLNQFLWFCVGLFIGDMVGMFSIALLVSNRLREEDDHD